MRRRNILHRNLNPFNQSSIESIHEITDPRFYFHEQHSRADFESFAKEFGNEITVEADTHNIVRSPPISLCNPGNVATAPSTVYMDIRQGDLAEQSVDMIVVSSASDGLRNDVVNKAGDDVRNQLSQCGDMRSAIIETNSGLLPCNNIFFVTCDINATDAKTRRKSINNFVKASIERAIKGKHRSIAFPAVHCGGFGWDQSLVAEEMILEIQKFASVDLFILIIILTNRVDLYKSFCSTLTLLTKSPEKLAAEVFQYSTPTIRIRVRGTSAENIQRCINKIEQYVKDNVSTEECGVFPRGLWNQTTINSLHEYCESQHVFINISENDETFTLSGDKRGVINAQKEFYRLKAQIYEQNYASFLARNIIWVIENGDGTYQQYSLLLNARIEDAYQACRAEIPFKNDRNENCKIDFNKSIQINGSKIKRVKRNDFQRPEAWSIQIEDVSTFPINSNDNEYGLVLNRFNQTMMGKYQKIESIIRIQNQRWYTAYQCYKKYFRSDKNEQLLFHGCPETSANSIIYAGFNRSFAGINGVAYGFGVYFSTKAEYSHAYTRTNTESDLRCMFLVYVLIGKSTKGNSSMKSPPSGYDTTSGDDHIFVIYHDDQAYAEYLIKYR